MKALIADRAFALVKSPITRGDAKNLMPKRAATLPIVLNGAPFVASVTSNRSWCGSDEKALEYIWIVAADGFAYYLTLGYGEKAADLSGAEVTVSEGVGPKVPTRVTVGDRTKIEAARVEKFKEWAAKN